MSTKNSTDNLPVAVRERLKKELEQANSKVASSDSNKIALDTHDFVLPNGVVAQSIQGVIVDFVSVNSYWPNAYREGVVVPPTCYAVGDSPRELAPIDESPEKQAESCATCQHNVFGSSPTGAGKACKNQRSIAFMPLDTLDLEEGKPVDIFKLNVPPASLRAFDGYIKKLANEDEMPIMAVVTEITTDSSKKYASLQFSMERMLDTEELGTFLAHSEDARSMLMQKPSFEVQ